jgi:hypothetical protein
LEPEFKVAKIVIKMFAKKSMKINENSRFLLSCLITLLSICTSKAQFSCKIEGVVKQNGKNLSGAIVSLSNNSGPVNEVTTGANGVFTLILEPNEEYSVFITKPGYIKSEIVFSTMGFTDEEAQIFKNVSKPEISLFELPQDQEALSKINEVLNKPIKSYYYSAEKKSLITDESYDLSMQKEFAKIEKIAENAPKTVVKDETTINYQSAVTKADKAFADKDYPTAKKAFEEALTYKSSELYPKTKLNEINKLVIAQEKALADAAEKKRLADEKATADAKAKEKAEQDKAIAKAAEEKRLADEKTTADAKAKEKAEQDKAIAKAAEEKRLADEKATADAKAKEKAEQDKAIAKAAEEKRLVDEKATADAKAKEEQDKAIAKAAEEKRLAEQKAIADAKAKEEQDKAIAKAAEEKRLAEQKAIADAKAKEEQDKAIAKAAEEKRLAEEKALAETKANEEQEKAIAKAAEEKRQAEEKIMAEAKAKEKAEQDAIAKAAEERRLAEEKAIADAKEKERLAQEKLIAEAAEKKRLAEEAEVALMENNYKAAITTGDSAFQAKNYSLAKTAFNLALTFKPGEMYPKDRIVEADALITASYTNELAKKYPQGVTEEVSKENNAKVTKRIVVDGNKGSLYIKKETGFGATYYFKDGIPITEQEFKRYTEAK